MRKIKEQDKYISKLSIDVSPSHKTILRNELNRVVKNQDFHNTRIQIFDAGNIATAEFLKEFES